MAQNYAGIAVRTGSHLSLLVDYVSFRILILYQKKSKLLTTVPASAYIQTSKGRLYTGAS